LKRKPHRKNRQFVAAGGRGVELADAIDAWGIALAAHAAQKQGESERSGTVAALHALPGLSEPKGTALLLMHNLQRFLNNPELIQTVFSQLIAGKQQRTFVVVLAPTVQLPPELEKLFVVLEHALPDRVRLESIARELTSDSPDDLPKNEDLQRILDAAAGLTRYESEGAFALSLARHGAIRPEVIRPSSPRRRARSCGYAHSRSSRRAGAMRIATAQGERRLCSFSQLKEYFRSEESVTLKKASSTLQESHARSTGVCRSHRLGGFLERSGWLPVPFPHRRGRHSCQPPPSTPPAVP
jgi:hypothetical protein